MGVLVTAGSSGCLAHHRGPLPDQPDGLRFVAAGPARIHVEEQGQGPAVVLIHGFGASTKTWAGVAPELAARHRVITLDLMGFGWSDRPPGDYSPQGQARIVLDVLDELGVERADVVGHSWGASVALALTLAAPHRVDRVALYSAWVYEEQQAPLYYWVRRPLYGRYYARAMYGSAMDEQVALAYFDPAFATQARVDDAEAALARPGARAAVLATLRGQRFGPLEAQYSNVDKPVLLLWGREDEIAQLSAGHRLARELDAEIHVYERCGHFPMLEAPESSTRDLVEFLERPR